MVDRAPEDPADFGRRQLFYLSKLEDFAVLLRQPGEAVAQRLCRLMRRHETICVGRWLTPGPAVVESRFEMDTHPTLSRAVLGGFVGTLAMTAMMYLVAPMMGLNMDIAAMLGSMLGGSWAAGLMMHFLNGTVIFPAIYVYALYARVPGSAAMKGTAWGVALWLVAQVIVMPMMGAGLFSSNMGGLMAAMGSLVGHVLYGSLLGVIASAPESHVAHA